MAIFITVFVFGGVFAAFNLRASCRRVALVPRSAPWFSGFILSAVVAFGATSMWTPLLAFLGATPSGVTDPVFGKDLSFFLLALPLYEEVIYLVITILGLTIAAWAAIGFLFYPRPGQPWRYHSRYPAPQPLPRPAGGALTRQAGGERGALLRRQPDRLGRLVSPGDGAGRSVLPQFRPRPVFCQIPPDHRRAFGRRRRRLIYRHPFLAAGLRHDHCRLGRRRRPSGGGRLRPALASLAVRRAVALGGAVCGFCRALPCRSDHPDCGRAPVCRPEPDHP